MASVVVVGAGVAGLTCAWRLKRAGHDVEVLESEPHAGGRLRGESREGFIIDRGARCIGSRDANLRSVANALGIGDQLRSVGGAGSASLRGGQLYPADLASPARLLGSRLLSAGAKVRLGRLAFEVVRQGRRFEAKPELARELDAEDLESALRRVAGVECLEYLLEPSFAMRWGGSIDEFSWSFGLRALRAEVGTGSPKTFPKGMGLLTERLAASVRLRSGCRVEQIESETGGARVHYRRENHEGRVVADAVVVAVPGSDVPALCPKLTPDERGFFEHVRYTRGTSVSLMLTEGWRELPWRAISFPRAAGVGLAALHVDHHKPGHAPPGSGLVTAWLSPRAGERLWEASDADVANFALESLQETPVGRLKSRGEVVARFPRLLPLFYPGYATRLGRFERRMDRSPRIAFAGDYLLGPSAEEALTSGMRAATEIARNLAATAR